MAGVCQTSYIVPEAKITFLLGRLVQEGLLESAPPVRPGSMLIPLKGCSDGLHPSISIWPSNDQSGRRRVDLGYLISQKSVAEKFYHIFLQHGVHQQDKSA